MAALHGERITGDLEKYDKVRGGEKQDR